MEYRKEKDSFGEIEIESGALWGAQTERSRRNFRIGQQMPKELVYALANVKKAAAKAEKGTERSEPTASKEENRTVQALGQISAPHPQKSNLSKER